MQKVLQGDCGTVLQEFPENYFGAIVTDPPYGLSNLKNSTLVNTFQKWGNGETAFTPSVVAGFGGEAWDSFVPPPATWAEILRVTKPGAPLVAFSSTRTSHVLAASLMFAGWEIRDTLFWIHGMGVPKSQAYDEDVEAYLNGENLRSAPVYDFRTAHFLRKAAKEQKITQKQIDQCLGTNGMASWWMKTAGRSTVPSLAQWSKLKILLNLSGELDEYVQLEDEKKRKTEAKEKATSIYETWHQGVAHASKATWASSLKPAVEPIVLARKPMKHDATLKRNIREHGTGALHIGKVKDELGRHPSNILLSHAEQCSNAACYACHLGGKENYFNRVKYSKKATGEERIKIGEVSHPTVKPVELMEWLLSLTAVPGLPVLDPFAGSGATLEAARNLDIEAVGIEQNPDYMKFIEKRLRKETDK